MLKKTSGPNDAAWRSQKERTRKAKKMTHPDTEKAERCNQCGQEVIEIDNRGMRLVGCLTCNLWAAADNERWIRLGEEDLRALHQVRHRGSR